LAAAAALIAMNLSYLALPPMKAKDNTQIDSIITDL
jgi:hypothetical protein